MNLHHFYNNFKCEIKDNPQFSSSFSNDYLHFITKFLFIYYSLQLLNSEYYL